MFEGSKEAKILFVSDFLRVKESEAGTVLAGERRDILVNALSSVGIVASEYAMTVIHPSMAKGNKITGFDRDERIKAQADCRALINSSNANVIVPLGEYALKFITGLDSIQKQHLSILPVKAEFGARKSVPLLHPETIQKSYSDSAYIRFGAMRLKQEMGSTQLNIPERKFLLSLDCSFDEQVAALEGIIRNASEVSTDVETGNGYVNTVGLATSPHEAVVIESGPSGKTPAQFKKLWSLYKQIWESKSIGKIAQNGLFEMTWASVYGISFENLTFDTMLAMKLLHPTLERGLDNVGRIYTRFPYWKDDHSDWNNIRDWRSHLSYCGKDCTGQFAAKENMQKALEARGLDDFFHKFIMRQLPIAHEMQMRGFRLDESMLHTMRHNAERDIQSVTESFDRVCEERLGCKVNINSPKQVKEALKTIKIKIPTSKGKETVSRAALMKLKNKHPKETILQDLIKIGELRKKTEEYLNFDYDDDQRVRCSFDLASNENGLWVGKKSIFDKGFDATKVPQIVRHCVIPDDGYKFIQFKLNQPELRYIGLETPDYKLLEKLDNFENIPRQIAERIFRKPMPSVTDVKVATQVIKSANEMDSPKQFVEKCFARTGIIYQDSEAKRFMQIFFEEFPGCRARVERIRKEMFSKRMLKSGKREITYYDRVNDSLVRRALAFGPESYSNDMITRLCFQLEKTGVHFIARNHNSLLIQIEDDRVSHVLGLDVDRAILEISVGSRWGSMESV